MNKLIWSSLVTLGVLFSFVFGVVILMLLYVDAINVGVAIGLTVVINFLLWLIGPTITDLIVKYLHKARFLAKDEVMQAYPEAAAIIEQVATEHNFPFPKIAIIPDRNPTAFTYGSARFNARIVLTDGIFYFLKPDEVRAVVAHELGHVVNRDFIVMMIASTLVQILYEIYATLIRAKGKRAGALKLVAIGAYVLYLVGIYMVYYLSRTREYLADSFSAKYVEPKHLANALVKIAYGIVTADDDNSSKRLLQSTRHLGIIDVKNAKHLGVMSYVTNNDANALAEVMAFDKVNPWAKLSELNSTHPLTGKRIDFLSRLSRNIGKPFGFDVDGAIARLQVDTNRLYLDFALGFLFLILPYVMALYAFAFAPLAFVPAAFALGLLIQIPYRFSFAAPVETTVLEQMRNPYASPIRGRQVSINGKVIGRGVPGFIFSEDMMYQDATGLIFLDYNSSVGFVGNFFFALTKIKGLFEKPSQAVGWFYRGMGSSIALKSIRTEEGTTVRSHPILWTVVWSVLLLALTVWFYL